MFGWEFPPHISGGLGTACHGMTRGLAHHGVEVLFVVPRAFGDEDARFVSVLGANDVRVLGRARETARETARAPDAPEPARTTVRRREGRTEVVDELRTRVRELVETLAIESPLTPYLTEIEYAERLARLEETGSTPRTVSFAAFEELLRLPAGHAVAEEVVRAILESGTLPFTGGYGPTLLAEVARFAVVAAQIARERAFDVVHCHDWMTLPAGLAASRASGKPLLFHVHACEYDRSGDHPNRRVRDVEQLGLDAADLVVCVSHYTAGVLQKHYRLDPSKVRVVHNAVTQKEQVELLHAEKAIPEPIVLFLGRVTFQKGPDYFLEAAARVVRIEPRVKFVMSGSGDMLPVMIERAAQLGLARHVHFTGFLKGEDVERMYAMADIYVMPSVSEPFGITPLEAMALDTPVIVSRQSGVSEVLRNALKVDFWDVDDIANKVLALLRYPALVEQLTVEGRDEIRGMRWEHPAAVLRDVYREVTA